MLKTIKFYFILCAALLLVSCGAPKLGLLEKSDVIVAFGDSLTVGVGTNRENSYPSVLSRLTGLAVVSEGVSGETTSEGLRRLPSVLEKHKPALVVLLHGGNDILRNQSQQQAQENLDQMIQMIKAAGSQVVLVGVPEKSLFSSSAKLYKNLAEKHDLAFEGKVVGYLMRSPSKKSDPIHFNAAGYKELAEEVYTLLVTNGAF
jgi:acyl-CoA thioesterase-1